MSRTQTAIRGLILVAIVASATACSIVGPPAAPTGLQRQISQGAKADAEGRSQAAVPAKAAPARAVAGAKAITTNRAKATAEISGKDITAVGDSVLLASSLSLQQVFPGIYVNAVVSRFMYAGLSVLQQLAASGQLRPVVIVALGTNGGVTTQQVHQLMAIVGSKRKVVLVNTFVPLPYEQDTNSVLAAAARTYPNVVLANWNKTISDRASLLWPDDIHPHYPAGTKVYAAMIKTAVAQAVQAASSKKWSSGSP